MSKTISSTYPIGITFSTTASNPVAIESTGKDSTNTGIAFSGALYGEGGGTNSRTIHNRGNVIGGGTNTHNAIKFGKGGGARTNSWTVANSGTNWRSPSVPLRAGSRLAF